MKKKVLVVDLDGTLFKINTFHYFMMYLIKYCIKSFNIILLLKILVTIFSRGSKLVSHSKMKYNILKSIKNKESIDYNKFVNSISNMKRDISLIRDSSFDLKILATAAPACYANLISEYESFNYCLATEFPVSNFTEDFDNIKETKKNNTINHLLNNKINEIDTLVTDHIDDLPLMKLAKKNVIINPNRKMEKLLNEHNIKYEVLL